MPFSFVGQPFPESAQIGELLAAALTEAEQGQALILAAWGKRSGLSRMAGEVEEFRSRGGIVKAILGVDEGGATVEGLTLATELFDEAWVFHDPGTRTFHPKLYLVEGDSKTEMVVGSGNLTKGGLFTNYEAAVHFVLSGDSQEDQSFLTAARRYFESLTASEACHPLDADLIARLKEDSRVLLLSERKSNESHARRRQSEPDASVFGSKAIGGLLGAPAPSIPSIPQDSDDDDDVLAEPVASGDQEPPTATPVQAAEPAFFKALSANDVSLVGSPGQIIIPISFLPFFGTLEVEKDELSSGGPRQSQREFSLVYRDGGVDRPIATGRVILYEPASNHKRQNNEARFTFRDREILNGLRKDDVLLFGHQDGNVLIEHRPAGWRPDGVPTSTRFGLI